MNYYGTEYNPFAPCAQVMHRLTNKMQMDFRLYTLDGLNTVLHVFNGGLLVLLLSTNKDQLLEQFVC